MSLTTNSCAPCTLHARKSCCHVFNIRHNLWLLNASFSSLRSFEHVTATLTLRQDCLFFVSSRVAAMWMCLNMAQLHGLLSSTTCNYAVWMASMCGYYILAQLCWFCLCLHERTTRVWTRVFSCVTIRKTEQGRRRKYKDLTRRLKFNYRFHVFTKNNKKTGI